MKIKKFKLNDLTIRNKLVIHFLLISILPSILLGVLIGWAVDKIIEQQVNDNTIQLIDNVNNSIESHLDNIQNMTYFISSHPRIDDFFDGSLRLENISPDDEYEITSFLQVYTTVYPEIAGILIVNNEGDYISNELYSRSAFPITTETWYREAVDNRGIAKVIGKPSGRRITSHVNYTEDDVVSVVRAVINPITQEEKGVILIDLKLRVIAEIIRDVRLGKAGYLMVLNSNGDSIYSPTHSMHETISPEWIPETNYGTFSENINGERFQFIYQKSNFTDWTTFGVFPSNNSVAEVQQIRFYVISFVFFVCLFGVTASYFLSHTISNPINQLMKAMAKAEAGDLSSRYKGEGKDEVGRLGRSFNKMLSQINKLIKLTERQEKKKREAELHSLQANIKPHFLYNTLDTIQWMARKKNAPDVADMVGSLSKLFRIGLSKGGTIIPLMDEIEHIKSYLQIQAVRYKNKLNYTLNISDSLKDVSVLKIVLQPIVENAIYHGIKERRGPGLITIDAEEQGDMLIIRIGDNGKGMTKEKLEQLRDSLATFLEKNDEDVNNQPTTGYGVVNVHARLKITFGEKYGVKIDSELDKGTVVTIYHPIIKNNKIG
ncbi:two-component system sensor histidine kinase YesM [Evansella vedderi]|uniref:Two-component system sensor histidine kinase YesM n=1 Tax=Evansella vedderi TaxID=38282 RepID=A0ABT9ZPF6_9BACI|nr:sensor histidine kinase [Evansella vedderi]MDQ0253128.1 two-component system sensor histidine kinase YesM [Evansella vedderi]